MRRLLLFLGVFVLLVQVPGRALGLGEGSWRDPDSPRAMNLARALDRQLRGGLEEADFGTGSGTIDGEWWLATYAFGLLGYAQVAQQQPEHLPELQAAGRVALEALLRPEVRRFDTRLWGDSMLSCLGSDAHDHVVLGYLGVGLGAARLLEPDMPEAALHDRVVATLVRRLERSDHALLQTYPGVAFPVDNTAAYAAIGLHAQATGRPIPASIEARLDRWEDDFVEADGLVPQTATPRQGTPTSAARGSGTALASWLMGYARPSLSHRLAVGLRDELDADLLGLGGVREYRQGTPGRGDIDSGPLILGRSVSATGFSIGAARQLGDRPWTARLWATTRLFGVPTKSHGFLTGGPLGNALLLAALTTPTPAADEQTLAYRSIR